MGIIWGAGFVQKRKLALAATLHDPRYRTLIGLLVEARLAAGLSQAELGERLDRPQSFIGKIETLQRRLDALELFDLVSALDLSADVFAAKAAPKLGGRRSRQKRS